MDYELFLYTKTRVMDWRYIVVPNFFTSTDENKLEAKIKEVYKYIEKNSATGDMPSQFLYCFPQQSSIILLVGQKSDRVDSTDRAIWDFYGIAVKKDQVLELKSNLEQLLFSEDIHSEVYRYDPLNGFISKPKNSKTYSISNKPKFESWNTENTNDISNFIRKRILSDVIISFSSLSDSSNIFEEMILNPLTNFLFFSIGPSVIKFSDMEIISAQDQIEKFVTGSINRSEESEIKVPETIEKTSSSTDEILQKQSIGSNPTRTVEYLEFDSFLFTKVQTSNFSFVVVPNGIHFDLLQELEKELKTLIPLVHATASFETDSFYCFPFADNKNIVFVRGRISERKDYDGDFIIELFGAIIPNSSKSKYELKKVLPLLISTNAILSIMPSDFSDQLPDKPLSIPIKIEIEKSLSRVEEIKQGDEVAAYILGQLFYRNYQLLLPLNKTGVNFLTRILTYPNLNLIYFAFGLERKNINEFSFMKIYGITGIDNPQLVDEIKNKTIVSQILNKIRAQLGKRK